MIDRRLLKSRAKEIILREHRKPNIFLVTAIYVIIVLILQIIQDYFSGVNEMYTRLLNMAANSATINYNDLFTVTVHGVIICLVAAIVSTMISLGYTIYTLRVSRGEECTLWTLFEGFEHFLKYLILSIVYGIIIILGFILLIVPGVILTLMFSQVAFIMLDNPDMGVFDIIKESARLMKGHKGQLFVLNLSFIGWYLLAGVIQFVLGQFGLGYVSNLIYLWLNPYINIVLALYYRALKNQDNTVLPEHEEFS